MGPQIAERRGSDNDRIGSPPERWTVPVLDHGRVLVVENERFLRDTLGYLLTENGYEVSFAGDGREALRVLHSEALPNLIILDLRMPVMDGWEFRTIQKDDPKLGLIPVLAVSADASPQAAAISAHGYLRKPFDADEVMAAVRRVLAENELQIAARLDETERLASLGRLAANVGHEINNPLAYVILNLRQSLDELRLSLRYLEEATLHSLEEMAAPNIELENMKAHIVSVTEMLEECEVGSERIRGTVVNLQQLSHKTEDQRVLLDLRKLIEESTSMAWNQIRHRARLTKSFTARGTVRGNRAALGQVFLNLLINAAQSIPEGDAERNDIRVATTNAVGTGGEELVVVEIRDSGAGIAPELVSRVFEPYFTTKPHGEGTGLGLSISRQTISDHGGRLTVESAPGKGTSFRVFLPIDHSPASSRPAAAPISATPRPRGRILVIDDEPHIGRVIQGALKREHDVFFVQRASEALARLDAGEAFDMIICDLVMPDLSGPEFFARLVDRWPALGSRLVFMTGGAFTPGTVEFMKRVPTAVLAKPFSLEDLRASVRAVIPAAN
jgi:signal transduction histidine kinase